MKKILFLILSSSVMCVAQDSTTVEPRVHYYFNFMNGLMAGEKLREVTYTASTAHGITLGRYVRIAMGVGFDTYRDWQAVPVFGQVSYDFLRNDVPLFVQASYGWSHAWMQRESPGYSSWKGRGGAVSSAMIGYRLSQKRLKIYVGAGYKIQHMSSEFGLPAQGPDGSFYPYTQRTDYKFERVFFTIGAGWR
jgi:hypothetical protein